MSLPPKLQRIRDILLHEWDPLRKGSVNEIVISYVQQPLLLRLNWPTLAFGSVAAAKPGIPGCPCSTAPRSGRARTLKGSPTRFNHRPIASFPGTQSAWLASCPWDKRKVRIALRPRRETTMTLKWIAKQLAMGTWANVARRLHEAKS